MRQRLPRRRGHARLRARHFKERAKMTAPQKRQDLIKTFKQHENDTGSPEVQVALMTERINELSEHFKTHAKDHHSRRGLLKIVSKRRGLLDYLKGVDQKRYKKLIDALAIRK
jgi:small subunit ribosomal protein S15